MRFIAFLSFEIEMARSKLQARDTFQFGNGVGRLESLSTLVQVEGALDEISEAEKRELIERLRPIGTNYDVVKLNVDALIRAFGGDPDA